MDPYIRYDFFFMKCEVFTMVMWVMRPFGLTGYRL